MSVQKSWYTHISNVNPQSGSDIIANWYNEANTKQNPYTYRDLPADTVPFYLFISDKLDTVIEDKQFYDKIDINIKKTLKNENQPLTSKIWYCLFTLQSIIFHVKTPKVFPDIEFKYTIKEYIEFFPFLRVRESSYVDFLDIDTFLHEFTKNYILTSDKGKTTSQEIYDLYIDNNKSTFETLATLRKISPSPQAQIAELEYQTYENFINLTKYFIEIEGMEGTTWKGWKGLLDNLDKFPPGNKYEINTATSAILDKIVLGCFRAYIQSLPDETQQDHFVFFLHNIVDALKQTSQENPGEFYDSYDVLTRPETEERLFYTYKFRHDFDKVKSSGVTKSFTPEEIEAIDSCFYESKKGFSAFITLLKEKHSKQDVVDSLTGIVIGCKFDPVKYPGLQAAPPPRANFTAAPNTTQGPVVPPYFENGPAPPPKVEEKSEAKEEEEVKSLTKESAPSKPVSPENIDKLRMKALALLENSGTNIRNIQPLMNKIEATGQLSRNPELKKVYNLLNAKTEDIGISIT